MRSMTARVWHVRGGSGEPAAVRGAPAAVGGARLSADRGGLPATACHHVLDRATEKLETRWIELVRPAADSLRPIEPLLEAVRDRLAREEDHVGRPVDQ